jgi:hypothetical protein
VNQINYSISFSILHISKSNFISFSQNLSSFPRYPQQNTNFDPYEPNMHVVKQKPSHLPLSYGSTSTTTPHHHTISVPKPLISCFKKRWEHFNLHFYSIFVLTQSVLSQLPLFSLACECLYGYGAAGVVGSQERNKCMNLENCSNELLWSLVFVAATELRFRARASFQVGS